MIRLTKAQAAKHGIGPKQSANLRVLRIHK